MSTEAKPKPGSLLDNLEVGYKDTRQDIRLLDLPTELLINIYGYSINLSMRLACRDLWARLDSHTARLWFCINAFSPDMEREVGRAAVVKLQKYLLNQCWFTDDFARAMEKAVGKSSALLEAQPAFRILQDVPVPSRLLKGQWTDERINLFERFLDWGSFVIDTPPICHRLPAKLLYEAIKQDSPRGIRLCVDRIGVAYTHHLFLTAIYSDCREHIIENIVVDHFTRSEGFIVWNDTSLSCWIVHNRKSFAPRTVWCLNLLTSNGSDIWKKYQSEMEQQIPAQV